MRSRYMLTSVDVSFDCELQWNRRRGWRQQGWPRYFRGGGAMNLVGTKVIDNRFIVNRFHSTCSGCKLMSVRLSIDSKLPYCRRCGWRQRGRC